MKRTLHKLGGLFLLLAATACATTPRSTEAVLQRSAVLTAAEIKISGGNTVLDGLRLLRRGLPMEGFAPSLRNREGSTPTIYLDGVRIRDPKTLGSISVTDLDSMEYLDAPTATIRYGTGHVGGAIVIKTRRG